MRIYIPVVLEDAMGNQMRAKMEVEFERMEQDDNGPVMVSVMDGGFIKFNPEGCFDPWSVKVEE